MSATKAKLLTATFTLTALLIGIGAGYSMATTEIKQKELTISQVDRSINALRGERDELATSYETRCSEYRKLYTEYKSLEEKSGVNGNYVLPGSAKGPVDKCYNLN